MKSKFALKIKKLIAGKYFSTFQSIFRGSGSEITDTRKYSQGDSFRSINRKNTAKLNELCTSIFQQEKDITLDVFFDINYNWKGGAEKKNSLNVIEFYTDLLVYCKKNGVRLKLFYPTVGGIFSWSGSEKIELIDIEKHWERAYQAIDTLQALIKKSPKKYQSSLSKFLDIAKANRKKRAIVIFSDFLDVEESDKHLLKHFTLEHSLSLIKIPVGISEGQNYNNYVLDVQKGWDSEGLQTISL